MKKLKLIPALAAFFIMLFMNCTAQKKSASTLTTDKPNILIMDGATFMLMDLIFMKRLIWINLLAKV